MQKLSDFVYNAKILANQMLLDLWFDRTENITRTAFLQIEKIGNGEWVMDKVWSGARLVLGNVSKRFDEEIQKQIEKQKNATNSIKTETKTSKPTTPSTTNTPTEPKNKSNNEAKKQADEEKKRLEEAKKLEEKVAKVRQEWIDKWRKSAEAYNKVIDDTNKKLKEQTEKMVELKKKALETIADLEDKILNSSIDYKDKLAKRYIALGDELRSAVWDEFMAGAKNEDLISALLGWQIGGEKFDKIKSEIKAIQWVVNNDDLKLAITKEQRTETEKITAEYQKQLDIDTRSLELQKAKSEWRILTTPDGKTKFFDEKWNIIEWANQEQKKDFESQALEIQKIADEQVAIEWEKQSKIKAIMKEYEDERTRLNSNYYKDDKNLRTIQENVAQTFFTNEIGRMKQLQAQAIATASAINSLQRSWGATNITNIDNSNKSTTQSIAQVKVNTVADIQTINKTLAIGITARK